MDLESGSEIGVGDIDFRVMRRGDGLGVDEATWKWPLQGMDENYTECVSSDFVSTQNVTLLPYLEIESLQL
jgi:hypothetical protein